MAFYRKRNESSLVTSILGWLQCLENTGAIAHFERLNSGVFSGFSRSGRNVFMRGCRAGVSDLLIILKSGECVWAEAKVEKGKWEDSQQSFFKKVMNIPNHYYFIVQDTDDLARALKTVGVKL